MISISRIAEWCAPWNHLFSHSKLVSGTVTGAHIMALLFARERTGQGGTIQVSLFDTALGLLGYNLQTYWERGTQPKKCGSSHESLCPYQAFEAADGPIMIGVANDNLWRKFCGVTGLQAIVDDPRFRTNADRVRHREETLDHVRRALTAQSAAFWNDALAKVGVPCSPIHSLPQLLDHPHTQASGMIVGYDHKAAGPLKGIGHPVLINGAPRDAGLPPPTLGQHTDEILGELGLSSHEIGELRGAQTIG